MQTELKLTSLGLPDTPIFLNPCDTGLSVQLAQHGLREPINSYYLTKLLKANPHLTVLDVGGNIGYFPMLEVLSGVKQIIVYEPVNQTFQVLKKNMAQFNNVYCFKLAVTDYNGKAQMQVTDKKNNSTIMAYEETKKYFKNTSVTVEGFESVNTISLDHATRYLEKDVLLRCDIEGFEKELFKDIPNPITGLSFELHTGIIGKEESYTLMQNLHSQGFKVYLMTRELDGRVELFKRLGFKLSLWAYNNFIEKRVYWKPTFCDIHKIITAQKENPHIVAFR